ncbi:spore germination protein [Paenibacillus sp. GCM10023252]|uniref:spore germination protein n=1 Tax=Paenibacillus sp. GCM10023252 TaxID=3252649 RepID=UPI00361582BA
MQQPKDLELDIVKLGLGISNNLEQIQRICSMKDFQIRELPAFTCCYLDTLVSREELDEKLTGITANPDLLTSFEWEEVATLGSCISKIMNGWTILLTENSLPAAINTYKVDQRSIDTSFSESAIQGPQESFIESYSTNISMIRKYIRSPRLLMDTVIVGDTTSTTIAVLWMEGTAKPAHVTELTERLKRVEDKVMDSIIIMESISDQSYSIFPVFAVTSLPQKVISSLMQGKVIAIVDGSPQVIIAPCTFWDYLETPDDYYNNWFYSSIVRLMRIISLFLAVFAVPLYVSITSYNYQLIPMDLVIPFVEQRSSVPFTPIYEALFISVVLDLLREAAARLPIKIGQTIGIVGGIIIGQAAVEAHLMSYYLIIVASGAALASFIMSSYMMTNALRAIRYVVLLLSSFLGVYGLVLGYSLIMLHLLGLRTLGEPYLSPLSPMRAGQLERIVLRLPRFTRDKNKQ